MFGFRPKLKIKREPRRRRHVSAWVSVPGAKANTECRLVDISQRGGRILSDLEAHTGTLLYIAFFPNAPNLTESESRILGVWDP
jgi:hypothetical protein